MEAEERKAYQRLLGKMEAAFETYVADPARVKPDYEGFAISIAPFMGFNPKFNANGTVVYYERFDEEA